MQIFKGSTIAVVYSLSLCWQLFMLFASLGLGVRALDQMITTRIAIATQSLLDKKLELCAALLAGEKNILAAENFLATTYLKQTELSLSELSKQTYANTLRGASLATLAAIDERRTALGCTALADASVQPSARYTDNPRLPLTWPNWQAAYRHKN